MEEVFRLVLLGGDWPLPLKDIEEDLGYSPSSEFWLDKLDLVRALGSDFEDLDVEESSAAEEICEVETVG